MHSDMFYSTVFYVTKKRVLVDPLMHDWKNSCYRNLCKWTQQLLIKCLHLLVPQPGPCRRCQLRPEAHCCPPTQSTRMDNREPGFKSLNGLLPKNDFIIRKHEAKWENFRRQMRMTNLTSFILPPGLCSCCSLLLKHFSSSSASIQSLPISQGPPLPGSFPWLSFPAWSFWKTSDSTTYLMCQALPSQNVISVLWLISFRESAQLHVLPRNQVCEVLSCPLVPAEQSRGLAFDQSWAQLEPFPWNLELENDGKRERERERHKTLPVFLRTSLLPILEWSEVPLHSCPWPCWHSPVSLCRYNVYVVGWPVLVYTYYASILFLVPHSLLKVLMMWSPQLTPDRDGFCSSLLHAYNVYSL